MIRAIETLGNLLFEIFSVPNAYTQLDYHAVQNAKKFYK